MIFFALAVGLFAQCIFFFGILHELYAAVIIPFTISYWLLVIGYLIAKRKIQISFLFFQHRTKFEKVLLFLLLSIGVINLIGAFAPELAFDALWYHLTLPKLYITQHAINHIGGTLYYSDMPKLGELLYTAILFFGDATFAKLLQFFAGILTTIAIYRIAVRYSDIKFALLACLIFYTNLVVDWESTTAYIDLIRTFFEIVTFQSFLYWRENKQWRYFIITAILVGFTIETKLIGLSSLAIFSILLFFYEYQTKSVVYRIKNIVLFDCIALLIPLPWFIFSYTHTGNPVYPFFTSTYPTTFSLILLNPFQFIYTIVHELTMADDPISPIYLICLPFIFFFWKSIPKEKKILFFYSGLALLAWYFTPQTGGGRFLLPYLPVLSIAVAIFVFSLQKQKIYSIAKVFFILIIFIAFTTIVYRGVASKRYFPVVFGQQTKQNFLTNNLNFNFGDFYDTDNYFKTHIKQTDTVLLIGFHNLYYVDFPFIDDSWLQKGDKFNYIATQNISLPKEYKGLKLIYQNHKTHVALYKLHNE